MTPLGLVVPDDLRTALRASLLGGGLPADRVDEIADLATLAVNDALAAIDRTGARASSLPAQIATVSAALSAAGAVMDTNLKGLAAFAQSSGMRVVESSVKIGSFKP